VQIGNPQNTIQYKTVGGWLFLFCATLIVVNPLTTISHVISGYSEAKVYFGLLPGLLFLTIIDSILSIGVMIFGFYAGITLYLIKPWAVKIAKIYLLSLLGYSFISILLPLFVGFPQDVVTPLMEEMAKGVGGPVIYVLIWFLYLSKSKRVEATYHLSPEPKPPVSLNKGQGFLCPYCKRMLWFGRYKDNEIQLKETNIYQVSCLYCHRNVLVKKESSDVSN
jgi:hypothetical protein